MKILKILLILLVPAIGIVGCKKTECSPNSPVSKETKTTTEPDNDQTVVGARYGESTVESNSGGTDIVGSGDDDRDGGDKKPKKVR